MLFKMSERQYKPDPRVERALETLFILHADHEQNCSTTAVRVVGSSHADPYSCVAAGIAALYGPLHGGANEAVLRMLTRIGDISKVPEFIEGVKAGQGAADGLRPPGVQELRPAGPADQEGRGRRVRGPGAPARCWTSHSSWRSGALEDEYFVSRKLYPNVDFYSGLIYQALGLPQEMFTVLFALARTSGWVAQWLEMIHDPEQKIVRPLQIYTGDRGLEYKSLDWARLTAEPFGKITSCHQATSCG